MKAFFSIIKNIFVEIFLEIRDHIILTIKAKEFIYNDNNWVEGVSIYKRKWFIYTYLIEFWGLTLFMMAIIFGAIFINEIIYFASRYF